MNTLSVNHDFLRRTVQEGAFCIDATAGNGHDTAFLCGLVGARGKVLALDIQEQAVINTRARLHEMGYDAIGTVVQDSHANLAQYAEPESVDCIVFNLGWLPGGDHSIFTRPDSTRQAIEAGLRLLKRGGVMTICIYYGGRSGYEERDAMLEYLKTLDDRQYTVLLSQFYNRKGDVPIPVFIWKE